MYKIKPKDIEEVHWSNFDQTMQGRTRQAMEKIVLRNKKLDKVSLQEELDMGEKEWGRFGKDVLKYANQLTTGAIPSKLTDTRKLLIVSGLPGSGRELLVAELLKYGWLIVDDSMTHEDAEQILAKNFATNNNIIVNKFNVTLNQRQTWIEQGWKYGVLRIDAIYFDMSKEKCLEALQKARKQSTTTMRQQTLEDEIFKANVTKPEQREGFGEIVIITKADDIAKVVKKYTT